VHTPGGGGLGDPAERADARLQRDVQYGLVSAAQAEDAYGRPVAPT